MNPRNTLYLVCEAHPSVNDALTLAERERYSYSLPGTTILRNRWFKDHQDCGKGDHFKLAYAKPQNWDHSDNAQDTVGGGVRMALLNGNGQA